MRVIRYSDRQETKTKPQKVARENAKKKENHFDRFIFVALSLTNGQRHTHTHSNTNKRINHKAQAIHAEPSSFAAAALQSHTLAIKLINFILFDKMKKI